MDTSKETIAWNDTAILLAAGILPPNVQKLLARAGQPTPSDMAVHQWNSRRMIPNKWRPRLIYALLRENSIDVGSLFRLGSCARPGPVQPPRKKKARSA